MKDKNIKKRIFSVLIVIFGLTMGVSWNKAGFCIGDIIFSSLGLSPWSKETSGTHYPAIIGTLAILAGLVMFSYTLQKKHRTSLWLGIAIFIVLVNLISSFI